MLLITPCPFERRLYLQFPIRPVARIVHRAHRPDYGADLSRLQAHRLAARDLPAPAAPAHKICGPSHPPLRVRGLKARAAERDGT